MRRHELEHIIRAASVISGEREFVLVGTASLLASVPEPPQGLAFTRDADLYPLRAPEKAKLIEGTIGELSAFHTSYDYYAQGVGPETAVLPEGWQSRLVKLQNANTNDAIAYALEPHDLAASKLVASREKDREFVAEMLKHEIISPAVLSERIGALPPPHAGRVGELRAWVARSVAEPKRGPDVDRGPEGPDI
jgi:uncharacterized nucleotidyltransferase DUF6036